MWDHRTELEPFTLIGKWWIPGADEEPVHGELRYEPHHGSWLALLHPFDGEIRHPWSHFLLGEWPVIQGESVAGHQITLWDAFHATSPFETPHDGKYHVYANQCFVGSHLLSRDAQQFEFVTVDLSDFVDWLGDRPITTEDGDFSAERPFTVRYVTPAGFNISIEMNDPPTPTNIATVQGLTQKGAGTELFLEHQAELRITPNEPRPFDWYITQIKRLCNLLTLLTGRNVSTRQKLFYALGSDDPTEKSDACHYGGRIKSVDPETGIRPLFKYPQIKEKWQ